MIWTIAIGLSIWACVLKAFGAPFFDDLAWWLVTLPIWGSLAVAGFSVLLLRLLINSHYGDLDEPDEFDESLHGW